MTLSNLTHAGAAVPKFPTIPRLSIVVPFRGDSDSFESTLISVLQHLPDACEVIVPHAGDYDDPFELADEVRFVETAASLTNQIGEAAAIARGRFVHILSDGYRATEDWTETAYDAFEQHDTGMVVPVVRRSLGDGIVHAGWTRARGTACDLIGAGSDRLAGKQLRSVEGSFLSASFWRRDLLRSLTGSFRGDDVIEASMVYSLLSRQSGWRCVCAPECTLEVAENTAGDDYPNQISRNHRRLQAIADHFGNGGWGKSFGRLVATCLTSGIGSAVARATAPLAARSVAANLHDQGVLRSDEQAETIRIPVTSHQPLRRAA
ncbi:glycosyltransferase family A protein [Allorhodopirellula heiligendammensis]|uniref:glycosyltransferase family A protein n=1 Tax=Allorhodopirellula heiligendammensis TaxID=2714739 RepID=UPI00265E7979|nr:glycosyltransferase family A protein [Allorhodopirellula heiligendammensis]